MKRPRRPASQWPPEIRQLLGRRRVLVSRLVQLETQLLEAGVIRERAVISRRMGSVLIDTEREF